LPYGSANQVPIKKPNKIKNNLLTRDGNSTKFRRRTIFRVTKI
jgi:hypothetical protein